MTHLRDTRSFGREMWRLARFVVVGGINTAVHLLIFSALYALLGVAYLFASLLGAATAVLVSYLLNHRFTFRVASHDRASVIRFALVQATAAGLNVGGLALLVQLGLPPLLAQPVVLVPVMGAAYVLNRLWVFGAASDSRGAVQVGSSPASGRLSRSRTT